MASKTLFFCLVAVFVLTHSLSQKDGFALVIKNYREANSYYVTALALANDKTYSEEKEEQLNKSALNKFYQLKNLIDGKNVPDTIAFFCFFKIGELEHYFDNLPRALTHYQQAIALKSNYKSLPDSFLFKPHIFSGIICYNQAKYDSAAYFFKAAEKIQSKYPAALAESERLYNNLGVLYYESGNYKQAKNYFQKASDLLHPGSPYYKEMHVNYGINIATVSYKLEEYKTAEKMLHSLLPQNTYQ